MRKIRNITVTLIVTIIILMINKVTVNASTGTVTTENLNLRSEASTESSVIKQLAKDTILEIIDEEGNWYKVKNGESTGYVSKDYVKVNEESKSIQTASIATTIYENTTAKLLKNTQIKVLPLVGVATIDTIEKGEEVEIITSTNNWTFIQTEEVAGWIKTSTIKETSSQNDNNSEPSDENNEDNNDDDNSSSDNNEDNNIENNNDNNNNEDGNDNNNSSQTTYSSPKTKYVGVTSVYVRSKPTTESEIVTTLIKNTDVKVIGEDGEWYKVTYENYNGYIRKDMLVDEKTEVTNRDGSNIDRTELQVTKENTTSYNLSLGEQIVEYAKQYLGCPYVYGGSGSSSFDCSGFTMYVYEHFGYSLSHSATAQSKKGTYVAKEDLQPGDLVFFLDYETMDGIGHCGIYIGDGEFIHASSGTGYCVKISTLLSGSYNTRYATARRLI